MSNYDPETSVMLAQACNLTYLQYKMGCSDPGFDGKIPPDQFPPELKGFKQTYSFKAPELSFTTHQGRAVEIIKSEHDLTDMGKMADLAKGAKEVYFGFALEGNDKNIIALRGTQSIYEWLMDALCIQAPIPLPWLESTSEDTHKKLKLAKAHLGFLTIYAFLNDQIIYATKKFANPKTCYVTGHSLGGALSVLAALFLRINVFLLHPNTIQMYSYAGPRVGDSTFADAYNFLVPHSYRVVNLADLVPMVPPAQIGNYTYEHIGASNQEWSYLNQTGDIGNNHDLEKDYLQALQFKPPVVTNAPRTYPVSGLPR